MKKIKEYLPSIFFGVLLGFLFRIGFNDYRAWIAIIFQIGLVISLAIQEPDTQEKEMGEREK